MMKPRIIDAKGKLCKNDMIQRFLSVSWAERQALLDSQFQESEIPTTGFDSYRLRVEAYRPGIKHIHDFHPL